MRAAAHISHGRFALVGAMALIAIFILGMTPAVAGPPPAYTKEHPITVDATALVPQGWWGVPGVTPPLWVLDPETSDAYRTTEKKELRLKPGQYKFVSFTFDFPFSVSLDGKLEFSTALDQCVEGRGTQTLLVRCKRTYPHGGQRDPYYGQQ
jgi:hypothetical protein